MQQFPSIPEIEPVALAKRLQESESLILLDVREPWETRLAHLNDPRVFFLPLSTLANSSRLPEELINREMEIIVFCHLGMRSAQVTSWLTGQGWKQVYNLRGGIDAYAREIDSSVGIYR